MFTPSRPTILYGHPGQPPAWMKSGKFRRVGPKALCWRLREARVHERLRPCGPRAALPRRPRAREAVTARAFQKALPPPFVAYRVAEAAGWKPKAWQMAVYRAQELTPEQRRALREACDRLAAELKAFGRTVTRGA